MNWKKAIISLTLILAVIIGVMTTRPETSTPEFSEDANIHLSSSAKILFDSEFALNRLALSGSWEGSGYAQVWLDGDKKDYLVIDTRVFGTSFNSACMETCRIPALNPSSLFVHINGPGSLAINNYNFAVPFDPSGMVPCPNCKTIRQSNTPDHFVLLLVLALVITVIGAHSLNHWCRSRTSKRLLIILFLGGFITLGVVFGLAFTSSAALAAVAKKAVSIFAAMGVITVFIIGAAELSHKHEVEQRR